MRHLFFGLILALAGVLASCKVSVGHGNFDGSVFDHDAGSKKDAGGRKDAGHPRNDAAATGEDGGSDEDGGGGSAGHGGGTGGSGSHPDAGQTVTPADVPSLFAGAVCGALEACMGKLLLLEYLNGVDCVALITHQQSERDAHFLPDSIAAGRVLFRPAHFDDCLNDIKAFGCEVRSRRLPQSCKDAIAGQVALHQACSIDFDCAGDAYCDKGLSTQTCPGSCASTQSESLPCNSSSECADHLECPSPGTKCTTDLAEGDSCESSGVCPAGLVCHGPQGSRKCQSLGIYSAKLGDDCDAVGTLCQAGLVCESLNATSTMGKCKQPVAKDATCRRAQPEECPDGQYCKSADPSSNAKATPGQDGICADLPGDGASCATLSCAPGMVCVGPPDNANARFCHALQSVGGSCDDAKECYSANCEAGSCALALSCTL